MLYGQTCLKINCLSLSLSLSIGKTPLDPKRVKLKSYGERKLRQLQAGVRETLRMNKPKDAFEPILLPRH